MQNQSSTMQLTSPISSENLMESRLGELGLHSIDVGGAGDCFFRSGCITSIDQFRYIKIQPQTIDLSTRLWGINTEFVGFIPQSLVLKSIV